MRRRDGLAGLGLAMAVALAGCSTTLEASDYDQSCSSDADCIPAFFGDVCSFCACNESAVNLREVTRYAEDRRAAARNCSSTLADIACGPCPSVEARCRSARCVVEPVAEPTFDGGF